MAALLERAGRNLRHVVDRLPVRIILPDRSLPFEERWEQAESLPRHLQVRFIYREISELIPEGRGGRLRKKQLEVNPEVIKSSSLAQAVKDYMLHPPSSFIGHQRVWSRHSLGLKILDLLGGPEFTVRLTAHTEEGTTIAGLQVMGGKSLVVGSLSINLYPPEVIGVDADSSIDLMAEESRPYYQNLLTFINDTGAFGVAQKLVRFANDVITARNQTPITPAG